MVDTQGVLCATCGRAEFVMPDRGICCDCFCGVESERRAVKRVLHDAPLSLLDRCCSAVGPVSWWLMWSVLILFRVALLWVAAVRGGFSWLFAVPELGALIAGVANPFVAKQRHTTFPGVAVSFAYLVGFFLLPRVPITGPCLVLVACGAALSAWALACLGVRFTVAGTAWVSLCESGPYLFVRHPQALARLLIICGYCGAGGAAGVGVGALVGCILAAVLVVLVVVAEEADLRKIPEYQSYAQRVRWRLLRGVW